MFLKLSVNVDANIFYKVHANHFSLDRKHILIKSVQSQYVALTQIYFESLKSKMDLIRIP